VVNGNVADLDVLGMRNRIRSARPWGGGR